MAEDDNELEKRAIEELLRETDRARVRAETMGPAGWLKCPLRSTNKRFLLNTLRSTSLQRRSSEPAVGRSEARGRLRSESPPDRRRGRSRSPPREHRSYEGHRDHRRPQGGEHNERRERDEDRKHRHKDGRRKTHREREQDREKRKTPT